LLLRPVDKGLGIPGIPDTVGIFHLSAMQGTVDTPDTPDISGLLDTAESRDCKKYNNADRCLINNYLQHLYT
jgi:hypothetical protein